MTYSLAILLACLTLLCIAVHDRLSMRRIKARGRLNEAAQETIQSSEAAAVRAWQRSMELADHQHRLARETYREQCRASIEANRKAAEAWARVYGDDEPWR